MLVSFRSTYAPISSCYVIFWSLWTVIWRSNRSSKPPNFNRKPWSIKNSCRTHSRSTTRTLRRFTTSIAQKSMMSKSIITCAISKDTLCSKSRRSCTRTKLSESKTGSKLLPTLFNPFQKPAQGRRKWAKNKKITLEAFRKSEYFAKTVGRIPRLRGGTRRILSKILLKFSVPGSKRNAILSSSRMLCSNWRNF